ncbi:MAG: hypothetical protein P9X22_07250 [Candidatus Zapsychrus exili]|nr:hypothetical protein [Candidatus Zapsychrus exili]
MKQEYLKYGIDVYQAMPQKIEVLRYMAEHRFAMTGDIKNFVQSRAKNESFRVFLYKCGLKCFKLGVKSVWFIDNPDIYALIQRFYPDFPQFKLQKVNYGQVEHDLCLAKIRHAFMKKVEFNIVRWCSEYYLRALPVSARFEISYKRIPDAIFFSREERRIKKYFVEYERSLKNRERYQRVFRYYANRADIEEGNILYICRDEHILKELRKIIESTFGGGALLNQGGRYFKLLKYDDVVCNLEGGGYVSVSN